MTATQLEPVDLSEYTCAPGCDVCDKRQATIIAQGCADAHPVLMCNECLKRGLEVLTMFVHMWQKANKRVFICGDCYRPVFNLDTHLDVRKLSP